MRIDHGHVKLSVTDHGEACPDRIVAHATDPQVNREHGPSDDGRTGSEQPTLPARLCLDVRLQREGFIEIRYHAVEAPRGRSDAFDDIIDIVEPDSPTGG